MLYLIVQIWIWIALAAVLGFVVGWLLRWQFVAARMTKLEDDLMLIRAARDRLEQDNKRLVTRIAAFEIAEGAAAGEGDRATQTLTGERPPAMMAPRRGQPDDLKLIEGISAKLEEVLHQLGVFHYDQIAAWTRQNIEWVNGYLRFKGRIDREGWVDQAKRLARDALSPDADAGADGPASPSAGSRP